MSKKRFSRDDLAILYDDLDTLLTSPSDAGSRLSASNRGGSTGNEFKPWASFVGIFSRSPLRSSL